MVTRIRHFTRPRLYLTEWREKFHLSVEQLAERIGCTRQTVHRWENDDRQLTPDKQAALAEALGISPERLWHPPTMPSVDAVLKDANATDEQRKMAVDVVHRMMVGNKAVGEK